MSVAQTSQTDDLIDDLWSSGLAGMRRVLPRAPRLSVLMLQVGLLATSIAVSLLIWWALRGLGDTGPLRVFPSGPSNFPMAVAALPLLGLGLLLIAFGWLLGPGIREESFDEEPELGEHPPSALVMLGPVPFVLGGDATTRPRLAQLGWALGVAIALVIVVTIVWSMLS